MLSHAEYPQKLGRIYVPKIVGPPTTHTYLFLPESRNPFANGLRSIFSRVICLQKKKKEKKITIMFTLYKSQKIILNMTDMN